MPTAARSRTRPTGHAGERAAKEAPPAPARVAAIDIGSNSIHMIVAEGDGGESFRVLAREREMVRLGKSALGKGALSKRAIRDGLETLLRMTTLARLKGAKRIEAVATSAVREAANGAEFLDQVRALSRLEVRTLTGGEEGALIFRAVRQAVDFGKGSAVLVDIGGGSTEWCAVRRGDLTWVKSLEVGSLRCAGLLRGDPPAARSIEKLRRDLRNKLATVRAPTRLETMIATSGTAACCGWLADLFAGREQPLAARGLRELRTRDLHDVVARLQSMSRAEIAALPPVGEPRSDSILAGAIVLQELARHAGADRLQLCDRALREGLLLEMLGAPESTAGAGGSARKRQVRELAQRAPGMLPHAEQVARLAVRLFDLTAPVHNLGARERRWLEDASLLHDVGYSIHFQRHHKHSQYLISTSNLDAFDRREVEVIAHVARYHRGADPKRKHESFAALNGWQQDAVRKLSALLRVANALDRTHAARVVELHAKLVKRRKIVVEVLSPFDVRLELDAARHRSHLFADVFGRELEFRQGLERRRRSRR